MWVFNFQYTRSSSRYAALLLGPCGAGTLASRAGGPSAPMGGLRPHGSALRAHRCLQFLSSPDFPNSWQIIHPQAASSDPVQISQICDGKSPLSQHFMFLDILRFWTFYIFGHFTFLDISRFWKSISIRHADMPTCQHAYMPTCLNWTCLILSGLNRSDPVRFCKFVTKKKGRGAAAAQNVFLRV